MKLLFDQNLSPGLARHVEELFGNSSHVMDHALDQANDVQVWEFARDNGFILVTKDSDFHDLSLFRGFPLEVTPPLLISQGSRSLSAGQQGNLSDIANKRVLRCHWILL